MKQPGKSICLHLLCLILAAILAFSSASQAAEDYDSVFDEANQYFRRSSYEDALRLFNKANAMKNNESQECLLRIAQTYSKMGAHKNVLQTCDKLIRISGDNLFYRSKAWEILGKTLIANATAIPGKPDEMKLIQAEAAFREFLTISPEKAGAHYDRGVVLVWLYRLGEAVAEFQAFLKNPDDAEAARKARIFMDNPRLATESLAPDFAFLSSDGAYTTADELRDKVVLLNFWNTRNSLCIDAIPYLSKLANKFKDEPFVLISVNYYDPESKWKDFISQKKMNWPQTFDANLKLMQAFQVNNAPTYVLIDHEGVIRFRTMGTSSQIEEQVKYALKWAADMKSKPKPKIEAVSLPAPDSAAGVKTPPGLSGANSFRIPRPVIQIAGVDVNETSYRTRNAPYSLRIMNWASMPDELFATHKNLPSCSIGGFFGQNPPSRIEVFIFTEQGDRLSTYCGFPRADNFQSLSFVVPDYIKAKKIYITIKDRLTGATSDSDMVTLP
jgi:thiol-disulfide isomerase/thioredoxin